MKATDFVTTDISPRLVDMMEEENIRVKVLRSGDTEGRARIIDNWVKSGMEVLITIQAQFSLF